MPVLRASHQHGDALICTQMTHLNMRVRKMTFMLFRKLSDCFSILMKSSPFISLTTQNPSPPWSLSSSLPWRGRVEQTTVALLRCLRIKAISPNMSPSLSRNDNGCVLCSVDDNGCVLCPVETLIRQTQAPFSSVTSSTPFKTRNHHHVCHMRRERMNNPASQLYGSFKLKGDQRDVTTYVREAGGRKRASTLETTLERQGRLPGREDRRMAHGLSTIRQQLQYSMPVQQ